MEGDRESGGVGPPKVQCPKRVLELVERYRLNRDSYRSGGYDEYNLREEFIDLFFEELGWDMEGKAKPEYREVVRHDRMTVAGKLKEPDYAFKIAGYLKFFAEAKRPSLDIVEDRRWAFQLRQYGWHKEGVSLCVLTNFEHFAVYDTRVPPKPDDPASTARVLLLSFEEYESHWHEIADIFSKKSVLAGRFDAEAERKDRRGTMVVGDAFLGEIEGWRRSLATNLKLRNQDLNQQELNFAVQAIIDRIVFLRICEERGIEAYGRLQTCAERSNIYRRLKELFVWADQRYNSGLFYFHEESGRASSVDTLTPRLSIDDEVLESIIMRLYPPCPYKFDVLPLEILGQVYEQFLGKVIEATEKRARVVPKPEVRKAGGVFYTPTYIVDRIVRRTLGRMVDGKTPEQVAELRIVDPACGSGSFLLGAYQFLLDWHLDQYRKDVKKWKDRVVQVGADTYALVVEERTRILLNNLHGVDIDAQAVEVTKLSLLLKVLENVPGEVLDKRFKLMHERALPDLAANIKCGNSLLDYRQLGQTLLDDGTRRRLNPFNWKAEFPETFSRGGFDAVIGNPPYVRVQAMKQWAPLEVELYKKVYGAASKGNYDIYVCFIERGISLLNRDGVLGYIVPHKFFNAKYGKPLKALIAAGKHLAEVVHFGDQQVFRKATTYTCLLFLSGSPSEEWTFTRVHDLVAWRLGGGASSGKKLAAEAAGDRDWTFTVGEESVLFEKLRKMPLKLGDRSVTKRIFQGVKTSKDAVYIVEARGRSRRDLKVFSEAMNKEHTVEPDLWHPLVKGGDSERYHLRESSRYVLFPYAKGPDGKVGLIPETDLKRFRLTYRYLTKNRQLLEARERGRMRGPRWYAYIYPKALDVMPLPKVFTPDMAPIPAFSLDPGGTRFFTGGAAGGYGILAAEGVDPRYLLALLNSRLSFWYLRRITAPFRNGWYSFESRFITQLPIRLLDPKETSDKARHDRIVGLVDRMVDLKSQMHAVRVEQENVSIQRQIDATDWEIERLVHELYGLSEEEAKTVETAFQRSEPRRAPRRKR